MRNLAESSKEGYGPNRVVLPMMMMMIYVFIFLIQNSCLFIYGPIKPEFLSEPRFLSILFIRSGYTTFPTLQKTN
jgi:hypothetical protein